MANGIDGGKDTHSPSGRYAISYMPYALFVERETNDEDGSAVSMPSGREDKMLGCVIIPIT
jgi:hypothetical protein